jgi:hypothetical protein
MEAKVKKVVKKDDRFKRIVREALDAMLEAENLSASEDEKDRCAEVLAKYLKPRLRRSLCQIRRSFSS